MDITFIFLKNVDISDLFLSRKHLRILLNIVGDGSRVLGTILRPTTVQVIFLGPQGVLGTPKVV